MPIHEIRESVELNKIITDGNGFGIVQKEINLKDNVSHKMLQCDIFLDCPEPSFSGDGYIIEILVTPTPVIYTDMNIDIGNGYSFPNRAPSASNENVLFKQIITDDGRGVRTISEFPNRFISARPTFTWYMPKLYLTVFFHSGSDPFIEFSNVAITMYCAVESKKVSLVTYGMGVIREDHIAQVAAVMSNGRSIQPSRNVGQAFPMWKYGGVRPELMISGQSLANFFNRTDSQEPQNTNTTARLRRMAKDARQMQPNLDAFGTAVTADGAIPSWVRLELFKGVESGAVRDQWPPLKHADNGNTLTF
jgi:hypothetical protein